MSAGQGQWRDWISVENPPILAETAVAVAAFDRRTTQTARTLAEVIQTDLGFTYVVLRTANAGLKRLGSEPILDLSHALTLVGIGSVISICEEPQTLAVDAADERASLLRFINSVAAHSCEVLSFLKPSAGEQEQVRASLQFLPAYLAAQSAATPPTGLRAALLVEDFAAINLHKRHLRVGLDEFAREITKRGPFPTVLADLCQPQQMLNPEYSFELLAARIALAAATDWYGSKMEQYMDCAAMLMDRPVEKLIPLFRQHVLQTARRAPPTVPFPAAMTMAAAVPLAVAAPAVAVQAKIASPAKSAPVPTPRSAAAPVAAAMKPQSHPRTPPPATPEVGTGSVDSAEYFKKIAACLKRYERGEIKVQQMFSDVMEGLRLGLEMERVVLALISKQPRCLTSRIVSQRSGARALTDFKISLEQTNLFARLMNKPQNIWLNNRTRPKLLPLVPPTLQHVIDPEGFFASSLFVRGKAVGMIYADKRNGQGALEEQAYRRFRLVCEKTAKAMEAVSA